MTRALLVALLLAGCVSPTEHCRETCDGCCKGAVCVPLADTNRNQCGRAGAHCVDGDTGYCPVCSNGACNTGTECFFSGKPDPCECGSKGDSVCGFDCGTCRQNFACENHRCVYRPDAGP
jgi:hypothetical protein